MWFQGYWYWVAGGSPAGPTASQKFALWTYSTSVTGQVVSGLVVTSGTLGPGWNYVPLSTPVPLSMGRRWAAVRGPARVNGNFNDTNSQFGTGDPHNGLSNGPLVAGSQANPPAHGIKAQLFATDASDPAPALATGSDSGGDGWSNFWLDVQVSDQAPGGGGCGGCGQPARRKRRHRGRLGGQLRDRHRVPYHPGVHTEQRVVLFPALTAKLATRAGVYSVAGPDSGTEVAAIGSPSWSGVAASGWVSAASVRAP